MLTLLLPVPVKMPMHFSIGKIAFMVTGEATSALSSWVVPPSHANFTHHCRYWFGISCKAGKVVDINLTNTEIGNLKSLVMLALTTNHLSGSIPSSFGSLQNLNLLDLYENELFGSIPSEIGNLKSLVSLGLSVNHLSGSIPSSLGSLQNLTTLSLSDNELSGSIPSEIGNLKSLVKLYLHTNHLNGSIPSSLGPYGRPSKSESLVPAPAPNSPDISIPSMLALWTT
ncbi:hypothetical protein IFM89_018818 [Coptis chinensis]|uniref:Uncharacterized protein n=1 Tax=Coptis chinensis TaxID=261450 RepID=A0A835LE36_9MAGN|nr:hypothetical protein IFM89_018818 [Coptis chinensis]